MGTIVTLSYTERSQANNPFFHDVVFACGKLVDPVDNSGRLVDSISPGMYDGNEKNKQGDYLVPQRKVYHCGRCEWCQAKQSVMEFGRSINVAPYPWR
jgi:hypothetical protein